MFDGYATTISQFFIFLGLILSTLVTLYTQRRNRAWDIEDRRGAARDLADKVALVASRLADDVHNAKMEVQATTLDVAGTLARKTDDQVVITTEKLREIHESTNGNLTAVTAQLDKALVRIDKLEALLINVVGSSAKHDNTGVKTI